ncbi:DUF3168 domain-containing protein [Methylosinus sporium]|uniref:DUF3168 domain-containing protein n=1 Tax=Methylosinus sporium TaxID=428 RepID=A0A549SLW8_METSR|nr:MULTISPECIES: DUF3168 domain-containing protein [Methylosinus]TRL30584.1 DUF3168 domain-containing protein [Methylosinus sporium]
MSRSPIIVLRRAIRACLASDATLVAALGGAKIYDEAPRGAEAPYLLFAEASLRDWSTTGSRGAEQIFTVSVVSIERGVAQALTIGEQIVALLDEAPLILDGHHLVDLRHQASETRRERNGRFARVDLRFRATTESL